MIQTEDPAAPLPDEALRQALSELGIELSRRAVAKYRMAMDIPSSSQRRRDNGIRKVQEQMERNLRS